MIKAFFADFYGTVVYEDGEVIDKISKIIYDTSNNRAGIKDRSEIDSFWLQDFQRLFVGSFGAGFETQRALETKSIKHTLERFSSDADADELSARLFEYWVKPPVFEDSKRFFETSPLPIYIYSIKHRYGGYPRSHSIPRACSGGCFYLGGRESLQAET